MNQVQLVPGTVGNYREYVDDFVAPPTLRSVVGHERSQCFLLPRRRSFTSPAGRSQYLPAGFLSGRRDKKRRSAWRARGAQSRCRSL